MALNNSLFSCSYGKCYQGKVKESMRIYNGGYELGAQGNLSEELTFEVSFEIIRCPYICVRGSGLDHSRQGK